MNIKMHRNHKTGLLLSLLLWAMLPLQGQVDICYSFEDATPNSIMKNYTMSPTFRRMLWTMVCLSVI